MPYQPVLFATQSAMHDSERQSTPQRLVNMFPESTVTEDTPVLIRSCPGRTKSVTGESSPVRAMLETSSAIYYAANAKLWSFDGTTATELGAIPDDASTSLAFNGTQVAAVAGGAYHLWDGSTVSAIVGQAFTSFGSVDYMDGYFLFTEKDGGRHAVSALNDGASLNALDFASAEYRPDDIVRGFVDHSEWWLFGQTTVEVWSNQGLLDYPFERVPGAQMERGCLQTNTVAKMDNTVFWLGNDRIVYRAVQYTPQRVSNHHVEAALREATPDVAFVYEYEGHKFYVLHFEDRPAWVFDAATNVWHERASGVDMDAWDVLAAARLGNVWYVGDKDGNISKVERVFQENGATLLRTAQSSNLWLGGERFTVNKANVDVKAGQDTTIMFQYSNDKGRTWSREQTMSAGATGDYDNHWSFWNLGQGRHFAARLACSDNADFSISHAGVEIVQ